MNKYKVGDNMNKVKCDSCNKEFEIKLQVKKHPGAVEETYFICPKCKERYVSYFTDKDIRAKQKQINKLWEEYRKAKTQEEVVRIADKIATLKAEIGENIDKLKRKMLGTQ